MPLVHLHMLQHLTRRCRIVQQLYSSTKLLLLPGLVKVAEGQPDPQEPAVEVGMRGERLHDGLYALRKRSPVLSNAGEDARQGLSGVSPVLGRLDASVDSLECRSMSRRL